MKDITIARSIPSADAQEGLQEALKAALGGVFIGISASLNAGSCVLHLDDSATPEQQNTAVTVALSHDLNTKTPRQITLAALKTTAQSTEGVALTDLTAAQVKALLAVVLYRQGAVANDGKVRPLSEWVG